MTYKSINLNDISKHAAVNYIHQVKETRKEKPKIVWLIDVLNNQQTNKCSQQPADQYMC
jgi:hypothetical protein